MPLAGASSIQVSTGPNQAAGQQIGSPSNYIYGPTTPNKNMWYPRPEKFDKLNGFQGAITEEIKNNYFRAGVFTAVDPINNNHSGLQKSSYQIIDLSDYGDLIDGKIYGLAGFRAVLFGWLGTRADQGDIVSVKIEFLDENDEELSNLVNPFAVTKIESLNMRRRLVNAARNVIADPLTVYDVGYYTANLGFYTGLLNDGNDFIEVPKYQLQINSTVQNGVTETQTINGLSKSIIIGRSTDMIKLPFKTRKLRIIKNYHHEPGIYDLINDGEGWEAQGSEYISDAMAVGLNVRLYPILIEENDSVSDTGIVPGTSTTSVIQGMDMDKLVQQNSADFGSMQTYIKNQSLLQDSNLDLDKIELVQKASLQDFQTYLQTFDARRSSPISILDENDRGRILPATALKDTITGMQYAYQANLPLVEIYKTTLSQNAQRMQEFIKLLTDTPVTLNANYPSGISGDSVLRRAGITEEPGSNFICIQYNPGNSETKDAREYRYWVHTYTGPPGTYSYLNTRAYSSNGPLWGEWRGSWTSTQIDGTNPFFDPGAAVGISNSSWWYQLPPLNQKYPVRGIVWGQQAIHVAVNGTSETGMFYCFRSYYDADYDSIRWGHGFDEKTNRQDWELKANGINHSATGPWHTRTGNYVISDGILIPRGDIYHIHAIYASKDGIYDSNGIGFSLTDGITSLTDEITPNGNGT